jgi:hypothetical protein
MNRAVMDTTTNIIVNIIAIEADSKWVPPKNCVLLSEKESEGLGIGDTYKDGDIIHSEIPISNVEIYSKAVTDSERLDIIAKMLGLK